MRADNQGPGEDPAAFRIYNAKSLGLAIRELRRQHELTQSDLARQLGIPRRYISTLEQGHSTEQLDRLIRVLQALDARIVIQERAGW